MRSNLHEHRGAICHRVHDARLACGMTHEGFAQNLTVASGKVVSPRDVRRYERSRVPWELLDEIARLTGTSRDWLLSGDSEHAPGELWEKSVWDDAPGAPVAAESASSPRPHLPIARLLRGILLGIPLALGVQVMTGTPALGGVVLVLAVGASLLREPRARRPPGR